MPTKKKQNDGLRLVAYCGLYCDLCAERGRIPLRAQSLVDSMRIGGWDRWAGDVPGFTEFWKFLSGLSGGGCGGLPRRQGAGSDAGRAAVLRHPQVRTEAEDRHLRLLPGLAVPSDQEAGQELCDADCRWRAAEADWSGQMAEGTKEKGRDRVLLLRHPLPTRRSARRLNRARIRLRPQGNGETIRNPACPAPCVWVPVTCRFPNTANR